MLTVSRFIYQVNLLEEGNIPLGIPIPPTYHVKSTISFFPETFFFRRRSNAPNKPSNQLEVVVPSRPTLGDSYRI
jgi:hypothetical protein